MPVYGQIPQACVRNDEKMESLPQYPPPQLYVPYRGKLEVAPIQNLDREIEIFISQAFIRYTMILEPSTLKKADGLFMMRTEGTVSSFEAKIESKRGKVRLVDTAVIANKDLEELPKTKAKSKRGRQALAELAKGQEAYMFRVPISNIRKGDKITITVEWIEDVPAGDDGKYQFALDGAYDKDTVANATLSTQLQIHCAPPAVQNAPALTYESSTHNVSVVDGKGYDVRLSLTPKSGSDGDVRMTYYMPSTSILAACVEQPARENAWDKRGSFMVVATPPTQTIGRFQRDVIFLVDRSGSMSGNPFTGANDGLKAALETLQDEDYFCVRNFDHEIADMSNGTLMPATAANKAKALKWCRETGPRGATDIKTPLMQSLNTLKRASEEAKGARISLKSVVLITDGCVQAEKTIASEVNEFMVNYGAKCGIRVQTVGLGPYCNHQFLKMLATVGRGFSAFVNDMNESKPGNVQRNVRMAIGGLMRKTSFPILTNITLDMNVSGCELYPFPIPDLFKSVPLTIAGKYDGKFPDSIVFQGTLPNGQMFRQSLAVTHNSLLPIDRIFAKKRIDDLTVKYWHTDDKKVLSQLEEVCVDENIASPYATAVAYETTPEKKAKEQKERGKGGKPSTNTALLVGALAVGGIIALGVAYQMGGASAIASTANNASSALQPAAQAIGDVVGDIGDCCGGCCNGLFESTGDLCQCFEPVCGNCGDACSSLDGPCASVRGLVKPICSGCCESVADVCQPASKCVTNLCGGVCETFGSCGDLVTGSFGQLNSLEDVCGSVSEVCETNCDNIECCDSLEDVCTGICENASEIITGCFGSLGNLCEGCDFGALCSSVGNLCEGCDFGALCESLGDVDFGAVCGSLCEILGSVKV